MRMAVKRTRNILLWISIFYFTQGLESSFPSSTYSLDYTVMISLCYHKEWNFLHDEENTLG